MNFPSHQVKKGDIVSLKPTKSDKKILKDIKALIKKQKIPNWLEMNVDKLEGKVIGEPNLEEVSPPVEISTIFEFYSR